MTEILKKVCQLCGAQPGEPCITSGGNVMRHTHARRYHKSVISAPAPALFAVPNRDGLPDVALLDLPERSIVRFIGSQNVAVKDNRRHDLWLVGGFIGHFSSSEISSNYGGVEVVWMPDA